ncbi:MAG: primosomal protein N', partial [Gemmatimonadetes bacterium]|nr:primosomal protein N' [Gemmatimonadota bacterium]
MPGPRSSLVEVALPVPVRRLFTYRVAGAPPPAGTAVRVPFRKRTLTGWVVGGGTEVAGVRDVLGVMDSRLGAGSELLELARWIADYYVAPLGVVLRAMLPPPGRATPRRRLVAR